MADQITVPVRFVRGGTSKGLFFRWDDLPADAALRDAMLCAAIGSPDPNGRQLDGMGGGISSLSKAMIVRRSTRPDVDVDYLFAQIGVDRAFVDYGGNCGNLSAAVGCFAVDSGFVQKPDGAATVRMFNENTQKRVDARLIVRGGQAAVAGDASIDGVSGTGAPIWLDFLDPGGAGTGQLLPTHQPVQTLATASGAFEVSIVDACNPCVFVTAASLGLSGVETPAEIKARPDILATLEDIREAAGVAAGMADSAEQARQHSPGVPKVALVSGPCDWTALSGTVFPADSADVQVRMISMGAPHLAIPLTGAMCTAVAARIAGSLVQQSARPVANDAPLRVGHGSGVLEAMAEMDPTGAATRASVLRTARTLMTGEVLVPASLYTHVKFRSEGMINA